MSDREMLDLLAAEAAVPGPGHVRETLLRARRARRRRRLAVLGGTFGVVAVTLVAVALVVPSGVDRHPATTSRPSGGTGQPSTSMASTAPGADQPMSAEAAAYAAAIVALADQVRQDGPRWPILYVLNHTCANVVTPGQGTCDPRVLPPATQRDLTTALASYAPVQFVADGADVTDPAAGLAVINGGVQVTLGRLQLNGTEAQVPLSVRRNGLNGRGLTYRLTRQGQAWRIAGTVGTAWIS